MKQRQTYRFYPTKEQEEHFAKTFGCCRFVWNWGLSLRTEAFKSVHDRDKNASLNILAVGQTVSASGVSVRAAKVSTLEARSRRRMNQPKRLRV